MTNGYCRRHGDDIGQFVQCRIAMALAKVCTHNWMTTTSHLDDDNIASGRQSRSELELGDDGQDG
ncbi:hypothetical protein [Mesorhizobium sp. CA8]|uniref:hypothetical protein n=1 Tax=Mesorhizobium sp. CA8 TaxID=2876637 RepID=UPI001CCA5ED1|nr:hypothetical protein [Mesorhizobium sp. CA8]